MFEWLWQLRRKARMPRTEHEAEIREAQREQRQKFDAWDATLREVDRVQRLAERRHHPRPHR